MRVDEAQPGLRVNPENRFAVTDHRQEFLEKSDCDDSAHPIHLATSPALFIPPFAGSEYELVKELVDALPGEVAIIAPDGSMAHVGGAWNSAPDGPGRGPPAEPPHPWLASARDARRVAKAASLVLSGQVEVAELNLSPTSRGARRHFRLRIAPLGRKAVYGAVIMKEDVTELRQLHRDKQILTEQLVRSEEQERRRIAREMHDSTVQDLVAIGLNLTRLRHLADDPVAQEVLAEVRTILTRTQEDVRTMSYLLHPPLLDEGGLVLALASLIRGLSSRMSTRIEFDCDVSDSRLPADVEIALYRVAQEALINIHKHASATHAVVRYHRREDRLILEIEDDGVGLSGNAHYGGSGVGIQGMRARLAQLDGTLTFSDRRHRGTRLRAVLPLREEPSVRAAA